MTCRKQNNVHERQSQVPDEPPIQTVSAATSRVRRPAAWALAAHREHALIKLRDSEFDPAICEFCLTSHGLDVVDSLDGAEELMTGVAHETPRARPQKPGSRRARTKPKRRRG